MANTANDLAKAVALEIGFLASGNELESDENESLKLRSRFVHEQLRRLKVCYWDEDDIPDVVYDPLVRYLAAICGKMFGLAVRDEGMTEAQTRNARLRELRAVATHPYTGQPLKTEYF